MYHDDFDSILSQDFRFHWANGSIRLFLNNYVYIKYNKNKDFKYLSKLLNLDPFNKDSFIDWAPADFELKNEVPEQIAIDACNYVYDVLWDSSAEDFFYEFFPKATKKEFEQFNQYKDVINVYKKTNRIDKF